MQTILDRPADARSFSTANRYNLYAGVHKALRAFMADTLIKIGRMDAEDPCEVGAALEQLRTLLTLCRHHLQHENDFVHTAMERVRLDSAAQTAEDHIDHVHEIEALENATSAYAAASPAERAMLTHGLYLALALFVGENFAHMNVEETDNLAVLVEGYDEGQIFALEAEILQHIPPQEGMIWQRWILSYMNAGERALALRNARAHAPPEAFAGLMALARDVLSERDWYKLERSLQ